MKISTLGSLTAATILSVSATSTSFAETREAYSQSDEVRAIVSEMMADADSRSSMSDNAAFGHDGRFFLASSDGAFRLNVGGQLQFRYVASFRDGDGESDEQGFTNRRSKIIFDGYVYNDFNYMIVGAFDRDSGEFVLEDAYVNRDFWENGNVQFGQFELPFMLEENIDSRYQLAAERSVVNGVFNQGRSQGVQVRQDWGGLRAYAAFSDGFNSANTDFYDDPANWGGTLRADYLFVGNRDQFNSFSSAPGSEFAALLGSAFHYEEGDQTESDMYSYTADLSFQGNGWNAMLAGVGRNMETDDGAEYDDFGIVAQSGIFIGETNWEPFIRYDAVFADSDRGFDNDNFNFLTAGTNYYIYGHAAKLTIDGVYSVDESYDIESMTSTSNTGLLGSMNDGEFALRFQFQLLF